MNILVVGGSDIFFRRFSKAAVLVFGCDVKFIVFSDNVSGISENYLSGAIDLVNVYPRFELEDALIKNNFFMAYICSRDDKHLNDIEIILASKPSFPVLVEKPFVSLRDHRRFTDIWEDTWDSNFFECMPLFYTNIWQQLSSYWLTRKRLLRRVSGQFCIPGLDPQNFRVTTGSFGIIDDMLPYAVQLISRLTKGGLEHVSVGQCTLRKNKGVPVEGRFNFQSQTISFSFSFSFRADYLNELFLEFSDKSMISAGPIFSSPDINHRIRDSIDGEIMVARQDGFIGLLCDIRDGVMVKPKNIDMLNFRVKIYEKCTILD